MEIKIEYNGAYPALCRGKLTAVIDCVRYDFPANCLLSGGEAWAIDVYKGTTEGDWEVKEWPEDFPNEFKKATVTAINEQIEHGCCGGCI
jgi:hypothetical protein